MRRENHKEVYGRIPDDRTQQTRKTRTPDRRPTGETYYNGKCEQIFQGRSWCDNPGIGKSGNVSPYTNERTVKATSTLLWREKKHILKLSNGIGGRVSAAIGFSNQMVVGRDPLSVQNSPGCVAARNVA